MGANGYLPSPASYLGELGQLNVTLGKILGMAESICNEKNLIKSDSNDVLEAVACVRSSRFYIIFILDCWDYHHEFPRRVFLLRVETCRSYLYSSFVYSFANVPSRCPKIPQGANA